METAGDVTVRSGGSKRPRPCSASYIAVRAALYQLTRLSDFRTEKIGGGFYADVFKVKHKSTGEVMVLKMNKYAKFSRQMLTEIQLMNRLSHPNILKFKGSCVHEGQLHALTEYINGGSLEDHLHNRSIALSWSVRVKIALDIAKGMAYLHFRGVFHRDLSSRNCLIQVSSDGSMKCVVADFGLAAKIKQSRRRSHTEVVGSPYWMAPECLNGKEYCEQADVFSYGIVLAETMTRLPADPDFMPRTKLYGMDFEVLHKMCPDCPHDLWELMVRCCQIDPDERPVFEEAVRILEQTTVVEEGEEDDPLRACFSEPLLRFQDSDDTLSGQSSEHQLLPVIISDSLGEDHSNNSCSREEGQQPILRPDQIALLTPREETDSDERSSDNVFEEDEQSSEEQAGSGSRLAILSSAEGTTAVVESDKEEEEEEEGINKGDSGIDPGEFFAVGSSSNWESSTQSASETTESEGREEWNGARVESSGGDITPSCLSPTFIPATAIHDELLSLQTERDRDHLTSTASSVAMFRPESDETVPPTTPCSRCCCSPVAPSCASDVSLFLPNPSTPWTPPPSPLRSNSYRLSSSLPSSPSCQNKRSFRFSMEVQEALFPPFDPSIFTSPSTIGGDPITLRSTPKSDPEDGRQAGSKYKRRSLRHSCGHNTPLPTFPEDSESTDCCCHHTFSWGRSSVQDASHPTNIDLDERFASLHHRVSNLHRQSLSPLRCSRSASNPSHPPRSPPRPPPHYALNLTRSPSSSSGTTTTSSSGAGHTQTQSMASNSTSSSSSSAATAASVLQYYTIRPCVNCRLSSSEPNLTNTHFSPLF